MKQTIELDWPDQGQWTTPKLNLHTQDLADEIVAQPLVIGIWSYTPNMAEPRRGALSHWLKLGDRENPEKLTEGEAAFIVANLRAMAELVSELVT